MRITQPTRCHNTLSVMLACEDRHVKGSFLFPVKSGRGKETTVYSEGKNSERA